MSASFDWDKYEKPREGSKKEFDWARYEKKQEPKNSFGKTFQNALEKDARLTAQAGIGALQTTPAGAIWDVATSPLASEEAQHAEYRRGIFEDIERLQEQKASGDWSQEDQRLYDYLIKQIKEPEEARKHVQTADVTTAGLAEKAGKLLGVDLSPQDASERNARTIGNFANPIRALAEAGVSKATQALARPPGIPKKPSAPPPPGGSSPERTEGIGDILLNKFAKKESTVFPFEGRTTEPGRKGYELAEEAIQKLNEPSLERTGTSQVVLPKRAPPQPLTGRAKVLNQSIGHEVSPEGFYNEKHGGLNLSGNIKREAKFERAKVNRAYRRAEEVYKNQYDIVPQLGQKVDRMIEEFGYIAKPNAGEKAVIDQLEALRKTIGTANEPIQASMKTLIKQADSIGQLANYEMPYVGAKGVLKTLVKDINESVLSSLERAGVNTEPMRMADKRYAQWAQKFLGDEISPFLEKTIRNPEAIFRKAASDEGTYRALKEALGSKYGKSISKLERSIAEGAARPYVKDLEKIGSREFAKDMANLEGLIGKDKTRMVRNRLLKEKNIRPTAKPKQGKLSSERITSATQKTKPKYISKESVPEDIERMMNSRSGVREVRKDLHARGQDAFFDKLSQEKALDILRGGVVGPEKITGIKIWENVRNPKNYEILSEIYGKDAINALLVDASKANKTRLYTDKLKKLGGLAAGGIGASKLLKVLQIVL